MNKIVFLLSFLLLLIVGGMTASGTRDDEKHLSSVSENLEALRVGNSRKQCWLDVTQSHHPCASKGKYGCSPCDEIVPPGPFPPPPSPPPTPAD